MWSCCSHFKCITICIIDDYRDFLLLSLKCYQRFEDILYRGLYLALTPCCHRRNVENTGRNFPIWLAISPTAAVIRVGTPLGTEREEKKEKQKERETDSVERSSCLALRTLGKSDTVFNV